MKFIHCADLHLDAVMESGMPPKQAAERRSELLRAFSSLAAFAKGEGVRAVIIAGDLFDRCNVSQRARNYFLDTVKSTPEVDFLLLRGNHDSRVLTGCDPADVLDALGKITAPGHGGETIHVLCGDRGETVHFPAPTHAPTGGSLKERVRE